MNRTFFAPVIILSGLAGSIVLMARTSVFLPLVRFIHSDSITAMQAIACLVFTAAGFACCYFLLNILCSYYVPRMGTSSGNGGGIMPTRADGGDQKN